jgi:hypothetical protein
MHWVVIAWEYCSYFLVVFDIDRKSLELKGNLSWKEIFFKRINELLNIVLDQMYLSSAGKHLI